MRTPDNLIVRAAIAAHFYANEIIQDVLAGVVPGVFDLTGPRFDAEGRLLCGKRCQPKNGAVAADVKGDRADKIFGGYGSVVIAKQRRSGALNCYAPDLSTIGQLP